MSGNNVKIRATADVKDAVGPLNQLKNQFKALGTSKGAQQILMGVGLGVGVAALGALKSAIGGVTDFLGDSIEAAKAEEKSIAGLDAALRANVKGYDGNRDAIEKVLASRMKLGFSDDEQRESLGRLVAVTGNATKALNLQRIAMDLARFRGMDLATASQVLGKVAAGSTTALTRLGIVLDKNATPTEALAELTRRLNGQALAYANTAAGKQEAATVAIGEAMEKLGAVILPIVTNAMEGVAEAVTALSDFFTSLSRDLNIVGTAVHDFFDDLPKATNDTDRALAGVVKTAKEVPQTFSAAARGAHDFAVKIEDVGKGADRAYRRVRVAFADIVAALKDRIGEMEGASADAGEALFGEIDRRADLSRINREKAEVQATITSGKLRGADLADAQQKLRDLAREQLNAVSTLAVHGEASQKELTGTLKGLVKSLRGATADQEAALMRLIVAYSNLAKQGQAGESKGRGGRPPLGRRAHGGPVERGVAYTVGERGPETFVAPANGTIVPNGGMSSGGASVGGDIHVTLELDGHTLRRLLIDPVRRTATFLPS